MVLLEPLSLAGDEAHERALDRWEAQRERWEALKRAHALRFDKRPGDLAMERLGDALEKDPDQIARMLQNVDTILSNGATASGDLDGMMSDTRETLSTLNKMVKDARPMLAKTDKVMGRIDSATEGLPKISQDVEVMVSDAREMVQDSHALLKRLEGSMDDMETVLENMSEIDKWELRRLLREEGILVRLKRSNVDPSKD